MHHLRSAGTAAALVAGVCHVLGCQGESPTTEASGPASSGGGTVVNETAGAPMGTVPETSGGGSVASGATGEIDNGGQPGGGTNATSDGVSETDDAMADPGGGTTNDPATTDVDVACEQPTPPRAPLRRITRFEYNNTVRDLLGIMSDPADLLPGEEAGTGFGNDADALQISRLLIDGYRTIAQQIAAEVTANTTAVTNIAGCDPTTGDTACQQSFLSNYLTRAFRHPPDGDALAAYQAAFDQGVVLGGDSAAGVRAVIERSLQSPEFLYRIEVGEAVDDQLNLARPTGYEMASRLSYLLWSSAPDPALLDAAEQQTLGTPEGVLEQARRMLGDERAKDSVRFFHGELFGTSGLDYLERDREIYPAFQPGMGALFRQETERFLDHVIWEGAGDLSTIFTAPYTFVNGSLATFYGIPDVTGDEFVQVAVDPNQRAGLVTQASILTLTTPGSRTDPVVRGKWLYTKMLCGVVPDPPSNIPEPPEREPGQPVREWLAQHRSDPACISCHLLMDPMGLAFEHYDGVGLWRDTDNGAPIDDSGQVPSTDVAGPFEGAIEFAQKLGQSADVRDCYVGRYLTYAYGRALDDADECSRATAQTTFHETGGNIQELMLAVTQTDAFLYRTLATPEQ